MRYTWNFNKNAEIWLNEQCDAVDECIQAATKDTDNHQTAVYIGECVQYTPEADCTDIIDRMQEQAGDTCGEVGGDWEAYDWHNKDELEELNNTLMAAVCDWMKKYGYYPTCHSIQNIKEYMLHN